MKKITFKIIGVFLGFFITFLILELAYRIKLRFFGNYEVYQKTQKLVKYSDNKELLVELRPNVDIQINKKRYKTNSLAYRDSEWDLQDTTLVRIGSISDSVGFPFGLNQEEGYEYQTEKGILNDSLNVEVLNFALNGYNSQQYIEVLKKVEAKKIKLDYLIANITSNDDQPTGKPSMLTWINHPSSKYKWIPSKIIKRFIEIYYRKKVQPNLYSFNYVTEYIDYLKNFETKKNTKIIILLIPSKNQSINDTFYLETKKYAESESITVLFPVKKFDSLRKISNINTYYYPNDVMHLSPKGHLIVAEELINYFKQQNLK